MNDEEYITAWEQNLREINKGIEAMGKDLRAKLDAFFAATAQKSSNNKPQCTARAFGRQCLFAVHDLRLHHEADLGEDHHRARITWLDGEQHDEHIDRLENTINRLVTENQLLTRDRDVAKQLDKSREELSAQVAELENSLAAMTSDRDSYKDARDGVAEQLKLTQQKCDVLTKRSESLSAHIKSMRQTMQEQAEKIKSQSAAIKMRNEKIEQQSKALDNYDATVMQQAATILKLEATRPLTTGEAWETIGPATEMRCSSTRQGERCDRPAGHVDVHRHDSAPQVWTEWPNP